MSKKLKTLDWLVNGHGDITIGRVHSIRCAATACDDDAQLAALIRRKGESLQDLLARLEVAVNRWYDDEAYIDEINNGPDYSI